MLEEPFVVRIKDKDYRVIGFVQIIKDYYRNYMIRTKLALIKSLENEIARPDYLDMLEKHFADRKHNIQFGSDYWFDFVFSDIDHLVELLYYCFAKNHPNIDPNIIKEWAIDFPGEVTELWKFLVEDLLKKK